MDEFDNKTVSTEEAEVYVDGENADNIDSVTHGVVYSRDPNTNSYSVEHYSSSDHTAYSTQCYSKNNSDKNIDKAARDKGGLVKKILLLATVIVICMAVSFALGLGASYLVSIEPASTDKNSEMMPPKPENDRTYIDISTPPRTEQTIAPGQLMSMEDAIESVKDSVVEITTETVQNGFGGYVVSGAGSGVIISTGGYIITNNHVIEGASSIIVRLTDGSEYNAVLVGTDIKTDIAVISINPEEGREFTSAVIGSASNLRLGQTVIAIGNPLGSLGGTVTDGIISSLAREVAMEGIGNMTLIQTNTAVSPGNSGGGLFDLYGRLVGIVNAKTSGQGVEGISFAIPVDTARDIANQLIDKGYVSGRPALGLSLKQVQFGAGYFGDVYVQVVIAQDYEEYGLKANDIIVSINGYEIVELSDVTASISANDVGDVVIVRIKRDRKYYELKLKLIEFSPDKETSGNSGS